MITHIFFDYYGVISSHDKWGIEHVSNSEDELISAWYEYAAQLGMGTVDEVDALYRQSGMNRKLVAFMWQNRNNFRYGLISNANRAYARPEIERLKLDVLLEPIVISSELGHAKPGALIFEHALLKAQAMPEQVIFVDDGVRNVEGAKQVGLNTVLFDNFEQMQRELTRHLKK